MNYGSLNKQVEDSMDLLCREMTTLAPLYDQFSRQPWFVIKPEKVANLLD
jgi:hypothetical protein